MGITPGDIVKPVRIARTIRGDYSVFAKDHAGNVIEGHIPSSHRASPTDQNRGELVCLPALGPDYVFAESNFEQRLIAFFYSVNGSTQLQAKYPEVWIGRWKYSARNLSPPDCKPCSSSLAGLPAPANRSWWLVKTDRWMMPVANSIYVDPHGPIQFCPSSLQYGDLGHILPTCYRPQSMGFELTPPLRYAAKVVLPGVSPRSVSIHLHGYLYPPKAHHGIWKHFLSASPSANPEERNWWEHWLKASLPGPSAIDEIFGRCQESQTGKGCHRCSLETFKYVDHAINPWRMLHWQALVDFWESSAPKTFLLAQSILDQLHEIEILSIQKEPLTHKRSGASFHPALLLWGWTYNWNDPHATAVLHLGVITFFLKVTPSSPRGRMQHVWQKGILNDVKRL
jgi:hypothetical protein